MRKLFFLCSLFTINCSLLFFGCIQSARYSPDEIKGFTPETQEHIKLGEVVTGMTTLQVRYAWGSPESINILKPIDDKYREEWVYSKIGIFKTRLIFIEGKLTNIITNEPGVVKDEPPVVGDQKPSGGKQ
ncbi:MAG: hypothetical protein HY754_14525 [Nitrospirae bacterium]|nr:hypothetical protein [Nitrospirota bacterium]